MEYEFGLKELYDVSLKTTSNIEINGRTLTEGETIAAFDKIQVSTFQETQKLTSANGGFDNRPHVWWKTTQDVKLAFSQGIFSKEHFAAMVNAKLYKVAASSAIAINKRETLEVDENKMITLTQSPMTPFFLYNVSTGDKITNYVQQSDVKKFLLSSMTYGDDVLADYYYNYSNGYQFLQIGEELTHGYFSLEGRTRVKDDITGTVKTGLFRIPKLKLVSDLSMRLGSSANPVMGSFNGVACPIGAKGNTTVMELVFLNDDIDSDM